MLLCSNKNCMAKLQLCRRSGTPLFGELSPTSLFSPFFSSFFRWKTENRRKAKHTKLRPWMERLFSQWGKCGVSQNAATPRWDLWTTPGWFQTRRAVGADSMQTRSTRCVVTRSIEGLPRQALSTPDAWLFVLSNPCMLEMAGMAEASNLCHSN